MIRVFQNEKEIFYGEVREISDNFDFTKRVYAVGELAFLFDSIQPQKVYNCSPLQMFTEMINIHNSQVEPKKRFEIGEVSVTDPNDYVYHYTNREDTLTALRDKLCKTLNGNLKITKVNGVRYINLVPIERYGTLCTQEIQFGENLLDYTCNNSGANIATAVIPLGAMLNEENRTSRAVSGLDEYVSIVGTGVDDYHKNVNDDFIVNDAAVSQFGYIRVTKEWNDVNTPEILKQKAIEWLKQVQFAEMVLEVSAFDLSLMDINIDSFDLGDTVSVWAIPFGMESVPFPVQKKTICMSDLSQNNMTLGNNYTKSYTSQASEAINAVLEDIPETSPLIQMAKNNALAQLLAQNTGGHIVYEYDASNTYLTAINVCNATAIENSTQRWVLNLNGFGYMSRKSVADPWDNLGVALTMDGQVTADFITTGTMTADRIRGGDFIVGGSSVAKDGKIIVKNKSDKEIVKLDVDGMKMFAGSIDLGDGAFKADTDGKMTSISGNIAGFRIRKDRLDGGADDKGIWIYPPYDASKGIGDYRFPHGGMAVGTAGYGLIQIGYSKDNRNVIRIEYGPNEGCYIDGDGVHKL